MRAVCGITPPVNPFVAKVAAVTALQVVLKQFTMLFPPLSIKVKPAGPFIAALVPLPARVEPVTTANPPDDPLIQFEFPFELKAPQ